MLFERIELHFAAPRDGFGLREALQAPKARHEVVTALQFDPIDQHLALHFTPRAAHAVA